MKAMIWKSILRHPEIELALVELFRKSSQPRYLALAAFLFTNVPLKAIWQEDLLRKIIEIKNQGAVENISN